MADLGGVAAAAKPKSFIVSRPTSFDAYNNPADLPSRQASFHSVASNASRDKEEYDRFFNCDRNYIILTNAGKPVFSLHGDIYALSSVYATLYAMISKVQTY